MSRTSPVSKFLFSFLFISCLFILPVKAQQLKWAKETTGGFTQGKTVCAAPNGNAFVYGSFLDSVQLGGVHLNDTGSFYPSDFIASYDHNGNTRWAFPLFNASQYISGVAAGPYGDLYIYGNVGSLAYPSSLALAMNNFTSHTNISGGFIAKCDSNGQVKWIKQYPYIHASGFAVSGNGNLHITGYFSDSVQIGPIKVRKGKCRKNEYLATLDSGGNILNAGVIASYNFATSQFSLAGADSTGDVFMHGAIQFGDSAYIGNNDSFKTAVDSPEFDHNLIYKITTQGQVAWIKEISPEIFYTTNMAVDAAGNFYLAGSVHNGINFGNNVYININGYDTTSYLVRFDQNGKALWGQTYSSGNPLNQFSATPYISWGMSIDNEGHLYAIGTTHDAIRSYFTVLEFNSLGKNMWVDTLLAIDNPMLVELNSYVSSISASKNGGLYFTGALDTTCTFVGASLPKPTYNGFDSTAYFGNMFAGELINKDSSRLGIKTSVQAGLLKVFPNPASQNTTIQFSTNTPAQYTISLSDLEGREVYHSTYSANAGINNYSLSLQNLSPGIYILDMQNGNGVQRTKIVKE